MGQTQNLEKQIRVAKARIRAFLERGSGICRPKDLASELKIPWKIAESALQEIALQYECRLRSSGSEKSEYVFLVPLKQRAEHPSPFIYIRKVFAGGWRALSLLSVSALTLIYGAAILLMLAAVGNTDLRGTLRPMKAGETQGVFFWQQFKIFLEKFYLSVVGPSEEIGKPHSMVESIYIFLAKNGGVLTCADVMAISGCDYESSDRFLTWLMLVDRGSLRVTDDGVLIYTFPEFREDLRHKHKRSGLAWQRKELNQTPQAMLKNNREPLLFIVLAFAASLFTNIWMETKGIDGPVLKALLAYIPLAASSLCFALPATRALRTVFSRRKNHQTLLQIDVMRVLHDELRPYSLETDLRQLANEGRLNHHSILSAHVPKILEAIRGERRLDSKNNESIDAPAIRHEWTLSILARDRILAGADIPGERIGS